MGFSLLPEPTGNEGKSEARYDIEVSKRDNWTEVVLISHTAAFILIRRLLLRWAALFLGELRDGLTMINMQSAFLIVSKQYTEKQAGILFFGKLSQGQFAFWHRRFHLRIPIPFLFP
jgi:hypothetical protein